MTSEIPEVPGLADLSPLGRGGLADVYLARQGHLERWVAAKVFRVTLADEQAAERFRAECSAIGRLDQYPHVLTVYDAGVLADGRPYLISERCDGSLADLVAMRGPLPADRVAALGSTIARALRFAHSAGVLHGDVTPQNLLLRTSGAPVLADFGLAVLRDHAPTAAGFTLLHAAPEALRPGTVIDERADVYGLGSTLYTVLTGTPPFPPEPHEDAAAYRERVCGAPPPRPDAPDQLAGLIVAMLAVDPAHRPSTDEVVAALQVAPPRGTRPARGSLGSTRPDSDLALDPSAVPVPAPAEPVRVGRRRWVGEADDALLPMPSDRVKAPAPPWSGRVRTAAGTGRGGAAASAAATPAPRSGTSSADPAAADVPMARPVRIPARPAGTAPGAVALATPATAARHAALPAPRSTRSTTAPGTPVAEPSPSTAEPAPPTTESGRPMSESGRPVAESGRPVADPGRPVAESGRPVSEPIPSVAEPTRAGVRSTCAAAESGRTTAEPISPAARPTRSAAESDLPVAAPTSRAARSTQPDLSSAEPTSGTAASAPSAVEPTSPAARPTHSAATPDLRVAEPTTRTATPDPSVAVPTTRAARSTHTTATAVLRVVEPASRAARSAHSATGSDPLVAEPTPPAAESSSPTGPDPTADRQADTAPGAVPPESAPDRTAAGATSAGPAWASGQEDLLPDLGPVAEPVRIPGRPRRRGHRRVLLAAGGASAVLLTGGGVGATWYVLDQSIPDGPAAPGGRVTPDASPAVATPGTGGGAPARAVPVDLPPDPGRGVTGESLAEGAFPGITRPGVPGTGVPQRSAGPRTAEPAPAVPRSAAARPPATASGPDGRSPRTATPEGGTARARGPAPERGNRDRPATRVRPQADRSDASTPDPPSDRAR